jgi:hypothetical protein
MPNPSASGAVQITGLSSSFHPAPTALVAASGRP